MQTRRCQVDGLRCHRDSHAREWRLQRNYRRVDSWEKHQNIVLGWERGLCRTINEMALWSSFLRTATKRAKELNASFPDVLVAKAELHTWLA